MLDSGAAWLHADGTVTERVRTLEIPLDENALGPLGELDLPAGAALLALRTHKADGRVLDADAQSTGEKRTVSAASLQTGDTLEIDYLMVTPPPRRGLGGLAEAFYFAAADSSLTRSIYTVRTDGPAKLDRHRVDGPTAANGTVVTERTHVNALPAEPNTPPQNEFYPWMQLGSGNTESDLARSVADQLLDKTTVDSALAAQISELRKSPTHDQRAQAETLWQWLSATVRAQGGSLSEPASAVMGQGSGNLLLPMRASLAALGIASHLVLVSSPGQSQEPHRFARLGEYGDVVLRIEPKGSAPTYLAAAIREAPFGRLPPNLCGARALVIPNVDAPGEVITLPPCPAQPDSLDGPDDHSIDLRLSLSPDGSLTGTAKETLNGFEAAALRSSLEELGDEQRRQGIESALASIFQGVALGDLAFSLGKGPGAPTTVSYRFEVPQLADRESGGDWSLPLRGFPAQLATRFAQLATRKLPLLISNGERPGLSLRLQLPAGAMPLGQLPADLWLTSPFGSYLRRERWEGGRVQLTEKLVLPPQRIAPADYAAFAVFADKVDQAQSERLRYHLQSNQAAMSPPAPGAPEATALRPRAPPRSPAPSRGEKRTHAFVAD